MTATQALEAAVRAGVLIELDGADLRLTATSPPPPDVLEAIAEHKDAILALLQASRDTWDDEDWQAFFDERAGVAEYDGGLSRPEAEAQAFESCVAEYLSRHVEPSDPGRCLACGEGDRAQDVLLPYGIESRGHCWLHSGCWPAWHQEREARAIDILTMFGIKPRPPLVEPPRLRRQRDRAMKRIQGAD